MVDGRRLNDSIYDSAYIGTDFPLDLSAVERVEVIRGPGSALYGTSAFLAVVNVITKHGNAAGARQAGFDVASFDTWNAHASHGWSDDRGRDVFVSAARYDSHGPHALFFPEFAGEPAAGPSTTWTATRAASCSGRHASAGCSFTARSRSGKSASPRPRGRPPSATRGSSRATPAAGPVRRMRAKRGARRFRPAAMWITTATTATTLATSSRSTAPSPTRWAPSSRHAGMSAGTR
jgi:outer membrane receptor protein involved in Fe transport